MLTVLLLLAAPLLSEGQARAVAWQGESAVACQSRLLQGEEALHREEFPQAVAAASAARSVCPEARAPLLLQAHAQMLSSHFAEADKAIESVLATDPTDVAALILKGQILYLQNNDEGAGRALHDAVAAAPQNVEAHYWLGKFLFETGQPKLAIEQLQQCARYDPNFYRAYDGLGLAYEALNDNDRAIQNYLQAIKLGNAGPKAYDEAYADLAELLLRLGDNQQAFDFAAEAADRNPRSPRNFFLAGKAAEQSEKYEASVRWLKKAAELDPNYPEPHYLLARVYRRMGMSSAAAAESDLYQRLSASAPKVRR